MNARCPVDINNDVCPYYPASVLLLLVKLWIVSSTPCLFSPNMACMFAHLKENVDPFKKKKNSFGTPDVKP